MRCKYTKKKQGDLAGTQWNSEKRHAKGVCRQTPAGRSWGGQGMVQPGQQID